MLSHLSWGVQCSLLSMPGFLPQNDDLDNMKEQLREQTRTIADLKQNLMVC